MLHDPSSPAPRDGESGDSALRGGVRPVGLAVLAVLGLGLGSAARMLLLYERVSVRDAVLSGLLDWGGWLPFVPLIVTAQRRLPLVGPWARLVRRGLVHLVLAFACSFGQLALFALVTATLRGSSLATELPSALLVKLHAGVFVYGAIVLGLEVLDARRRAAQDARRFAEARFAALEGHLRPHFLFNALNSIAALTRRDPEAAEALVARLGGLLRRTLREGGSASTLADEVAFVQDYLEVERARLGERLTVEVDVGGGCDAALLPRLTLQPLVENAVRHGVSRRVGGGTVRIESERRNGDLVVRVGDEGPDPAEGESGPGHGFSLDAVCERLAAFYDGDARLRLGQGRSGSAAELVVPFRTRATANGAGGRT